MSLRVFVVIIFLIFAQGGAITRVLIRIYTIVRAHRYRFHVFTRPKRPVKLPTLNRFTRGLNLKKTRFAMGKNGLVQLAQTTAKIG